MASASKALRIRGLAAGPAITFLAIALVPAPSNAQGEPVSFSATGDYPYGSSELADLQEHMDLHNQYSPSDFYVHVGDINAGSETCRESRSIDVKNELIRLAVPAFCLIGDNEWTDCSNPDQAWTWYEEHLANLDAYFCYPWELERQAVRDENWAFVHKGVLFAGINIPNGNGGNKNERLQDDADWVDFQMVDKKSQVRAAVILGHTGPGGSHDLFFDQFENSSATFGKPVLYVMGDKHTWQYDNPFSESNMRRLIVEPGGKEQPVEITVTMATNTPWDFNRDPWNGSPSSFDHEPCVDVGDDRSIDASETLSISALVQDDGSTSVAWTKRSGPGSVNFGNPSQESTTADFGTPGTYELRCTANDGTNQTYDELVVEVGGSSGSFLTITDVQVDEGDAGTSNAVFDVVLSGSPSGSVSVDWATADSSAEASSDYSQRNGTLTFNGASTKAVTVPVSGDTDYEADEVFFVNLFNATNGAIITKSQGRGTILNDDALPPNDPPAAESDLYTMVEDDTLDVAAPGVLANDTDPEDQSLAASVVTSPAHGTLSLSSDGSFTYAPGADFDEYDIFTYEAADGFGKFDTASVVIDVTPMNDPPAAADDSYSTGLDVTLVVPAPGVLDNDADVDDASFSAVLQAGPSNGILNLAPDGSFSFDPDPFFFGTDSFTYVADDGTDPSAVAAVRISVGEPEETVYLPTEDTYAKVSSSTTTRGSEDIVRIRGGSSAYNAYLKFDLSGVGSVTSATLRLYVTDYGTDGTCHTIANEYAGTGTPWQEEDLYYDIAPSLGALINPIAPPAPGNWMELDVTSVVTGSGIYSFGFAGTVDNSTRFSSKEGLYPPELVVTAYTGGPIPEPDVAATPLAQVWGDVTVGDSPSRSFRIRNEGNADLHVVSTTLTGADAAEFAVGSGGGGFTVAPGDSHEVSVTFAPSMPGAKTATLRLASDDPDENPFDLGLAGNAVAPPAPDVTATPGSHDWGDVVVGDSSPRVFRIGNDGTANLNVGATSLVGTDAAEFGIVSGGGTFTVAPGDSHDVTVVFAPVGLGAKSASLRIESDDPDESPLDLALAGRGVAAPTPDIAADPASRDFGDVIVGQSAPATILIRNEGAADLSVASVTKAGADSAEFSIDAGAGGFTLAPGDSHQVDVSFHPTSLGAKSASLRVASDDPDENPLDVPLAGNGVPVPVPDVAATPATHDFGDVFEGSSAGHTIEIRNDGNADLVVSATSLVGANATEFGIGSGGGAFTLAPAATRDVSVSFDPQSPGTKSASLRLASNDPDEDPYDVALTGQGLELPVGGGEVVFEGFVTGGSLSSSTVTSGPVPPPLVGSPTDLYLAAISSKSFESVTGVTGLGLDWTLVREQCGARRQTGMSLYRAMGPTAGGPVTATLAGSAGATAITVTRYSGVNVVTPIGAVLSGNTQGVDGDCTGGNDSSSYDLPITTTTPGSIVCASIGIRRRAHTPGTGWTELSEHMHGSGGTVAGIGVMEQAVPTPTTLSVSGTFNKNVDWSVVAVELLPRVIADTPDIAVAPGSHDFGGVVAGTDSATHTFVVSNDGTADLDVTAVSLTGTDAGEFSIDAGGGAFALAPGVTRNVDVSFAPASLGPKSATLRFASDDPNENPFDVALAGLGTPPPTPDIAALPASHDFGDVVVGDSGAVSIEIVNEGTATLTVGSVTLAGADVSELTIDAGSGGFSLAPGDSHRVDVSFRPASLGPKSALLRVASDDPDENPLDVPLGGQGVDAPTPDIAVSPPSHDYGDVFEGSSSSHTFQIRNGGAADLQVTATALVGADSTEFAIDAGGGAATLAPGATRDVSISFHPSLGARSTTFRVTSDDPDEPIVDVPLTGVGVEAPVGGTDIVLEEVVGGGSTSSNVVSTAGDVTAAGTHLYVAAISSKRFKEPVAVEGLGLAWTPLASQCAGRDQTGIAVWVGQGTPGASGPVTATLASSPDNAVIIVSRYSGVASVGNVVAANTSGEGGGCSGGTDSGSYSLNLTTAVADAMVVTAAAMRSKDHLPGAGWTEHFELYQGSSGSTCGVSIADRKFATPGIVAVEGSFSKTVDWAVAAIELRPVPAVGIVQIGQGGLAPDVDEPGPPVVVSPGPTPRALSLSDPRPNPFRREVTIEFALPAATVVEVVVYDAAGRVVRRLLRGERAPGVHTVRWDGRDAWGLRVASGVYFVRLGAGTETRLSKVILAR